MTSTFTTYSDVVKITDTIGGVNYSASGVLIYNGSEGADILTASHALYSQGVGTATNVMVTPAGNSAIGTYAAATIHYNAVADAGGLITIDSAQSDYALIHLAAPVDGVGFMGIGEGYSLGGPATLSGFPATFGAALESSATGTAVPVTGYSLLQVPFLGPGASGGPAWIANSNGTGSVVATASFDDNSGNQYGPEMTATEVAQLQSWMALDGTTQQLSNLGTVMVTTDNNGAIVANLYEGLLSRQPDSAGEVFYHQQMNSGMSAQSVAQYIMNSSEFTGSHTGQTPTQFVESLYTNMLGRSNETAAEISFYTNQIAAGTSEALIAGQFASSPEAISHVQAWLMIA